jgi:hypothetical protein
MAPQISFLNFDLEISRSICQICLFEFILVGGGGVKLLEHLRDGAQLIKVWEPLI